MAGSVNKVILVGNLGRDPEVRHAQDGTKIVNLNIATSESWKDRASGERKEKTEWHRVVIFNPHLADIAERYLKKGSTVYIEGALQTRKWTDQSGVEKYSTEVVIGKFKGELTLLGGRDGGGGGQQGGGGGYDTPSESSYGNSRSAPPSAGGRGAPPSSGGGGWDAPADLDDEIPF